jgi:Domain of unknown function (DUF4115)
VTNENQPAVFDEQRAIAELERLHHAIESARRRRREAVAEFDDFVRGFRTPRTNAEPDEPARPSRSLTTSHPPDPAVPSRAAFGESDRAFFDALPAAAPPRPSTRRDKRRITARDLAIAGAGVAAIAGILVVRGWRNAPPHATDARGVAAPPNVSAPATGPAAPASTPAAAVAQGGLNAELTTVRRVWVRVVVDGERAIERELPAGTRLPLHAQRTLAFRVGDAGAVRIVVDGRDAGSLGPDGQIGVRTFTAPQR